jgi:hypothetical protein
MRTLGLFPTLLLTSAVALMAFDPDASLDDIEDLAGFETWPSGAVLATCIEFDKKEIGGHKDTYCFRFALVGAVEWTEQLPAGQNYPKEGDVQDVIFMTDNDTGPKFMKQFLLPISEKTGLKKTSELVAAIKGMQLVLVGVRTQATEEVDGVKKSIPGKYYYKVKNVQVP